MLKNRPSKRIALAAIVFAAVAVFRAPPAAAQQLTRFAIVDLGVVYQSFFRESRAVREFEERSARVQLEVDRRTKDLEDLKARHAAAVLEDRSQDAIRLQNEYTAKSDALRDYYQAGKAQLEDQRAKLSQSNSFLEQVFTEIQFIAESEGYSMVLKKGNDAILWHSPTVDITQKVIASLQSKR
jgi:outer membrane protein